jgi:hypothetical protein
MIRKRRPSFRLQRLARSSFARWFAQAMAVLLVLANFSTWAMPGSAAVENGGALALVSASSHHHCDEAKAKTNTGTIAHTGQAAHGKRCPCCMGGACACVYSCAGAVSAILADLTSFPATQSLPPADSSFIDAAGTRRLRPPIA